VRNGEEVIAADMAGRVSTRRGRTSFDAVVMSTGSRPVAGGVVGQRKDGFLLMDHEQSYASLASCLGSLSRVALVGSGATLLEVADSLARRRIAIHLFAPDGIMGSRLGEATNGKLESAIEAAGIVRVSGSPERIAGVNHVEAVIVNGAVYPCEALVQIPRLEPNVPSVPAVRGRLGGIVVDQELRSARGGLFAAGSCAEMNRGNTTVRVDSDSSSRLMGEVAGANAAGARLSASVSCCLCIEVFGISIVAAGLSLREAARAGLDAREVSADSFGGLACTLVYDRGSLKLWGVQFVGPGAMGYAQVAPLLVSGTLGIDEVSYQDFPTSTDISPLAEAAREGLRQ